MSAVDVARDGEGALCSQCACGWHPRTVRLTTSFFSSVLVVWDDQRITRQPGVMAPGQSG